MAAIVSQWTAGNRRKKKDIICEISNDKSVYTLPPFDPCFDPKKHNNYIRNQAAFQQKKIIGTFLEPRRDMIPSPVCSPHATSGKEKQFSLAEFLSLDMEKELENDSKKNSKCKEEEDIVSEGEGTIFFIHESELSEVLGHLEEEEEYEGEDLCFIFKNSNYDTLRRFVIAICYLFSLSPFIIFIVYILMRVTAM
nr:uncharacterized protein LOC121116342 [Lepeophtheirus salmonis]